MLYAFGGACFGWGQWAFTRALLDGTATHKGLIGVGLGGFAVAIGALLHARREHVPTPLDSRRSIRRLAVALAVWLVPLLIAWGQFEAHRDPIAMFPISSIAGATVAVAIQTRLLAPSGRLARILPPALAATLGLSLGIQTTAHSIRHFTYHLSTVAIYTTEIDPDEGKGPQLVGPQLPDAPTRRHDNEYEAIGAIGEALDAAEPTTEPLAGEVVSGDELLEAMNAELEAAAQRDAEENLARRKAWQAEMELRRAGGRLFD